MADAYRAKQDTSLPRAVRLLDEDEIQGKIYQTVGVAYRAGDYILAENISPPLRESIENGDLDDLLEPADRKEAEAALSEDPAKGLFIPEHEAERYAMLQYGHRVVEKDQVLELKSAGADGAREALEAAKDDGLDERPQITEQKSFVEVPALADASREQKAAVPEHDNEPVDEEELEARGVEQPPGQPVGRTLARAEGVDPDAGGGGGQRGGGRRRQRPGSSGGGSRSGEGGQSQSQQETK
jgi:hypothetical protein